MMIVVGVVVCMAMFGIGWVTGKSWQKDSDTLMLNSVTTNLLSKVSQLESDVNTLEDRCIDGAELIAWIENFNDNYEYVSPPTSGEIIRKVEQMMKEVK